MTQDLSSLRRGLAVWVVAVCWLGCGVARAQASEAEIKARLVGKSLFLKGFWKENNLHFDATGKLFTKSDVVSFTLCGMDVQKVTLQNGLLTLRGMRRGLEFDPKPTWVNLKKPIEIQIDSPVDGDFSHLLDEVFVVDLAGVRPLVPDYWRILASRDFTPFVPRKGAHEPIENIPGVNVKSGNETGEDDGKGMTSPMRVRTYDDDDYPNLTEEARLAHYATDTTIELIVGPDGKLLESHIAKAAGLGMDEDVLFWLRKSKWKPGTDHGTPDAAQIFVEITITPHSR